MASPMRDSHLYSVYFAPRGKARMINLGWMPVSYTHLDVYKRQSPPTWPPEAST